MPRNRPTADDIFLERLSRIQQLSAAQNSIMEEAVRTLIEDVGLSFKHHLESAGYPARAVRAIRTKFRDAGRRSAPWKPTSSRVPGRPQDGSDGNRINRWLLPVDHKFYASEIDATLVEIKYYFQAWSMLNAPSLPNGTIQTSFRWLLGHDIVPGEYKDPVQLCQLDLSEFAEEPRLVQSGHLTPLDRGGRHIPENTFLMLARSNQLQGNLTLSELVSLMRSIVAQHQDVGDAVPVGIKSDQEVRDTTSSE